MRNVSGIVGAAPIFHGFMMQALNGQPDSWFNVADGLRAVNVNGDTAYLLPGTDQVAQQQQPPAPPPGCDENCGGGNGGGGEGRHKKRG
jgi:membrane carboxypeptidase/penicillin-binding protein